MVEIKNHEFEGLLRKKPLSYRMFLIYGPDRGLVSERAAEIAALSGVDLKDPFSVIRLDASDLSSQPGRIVEEMQSLGLFGGSRLVWIKGSMNEKSLIEALQILTDEPPDDSLLIVEAGELKKGAGTRKVADASRHIASVACYADDTRALNALIDSELSLSGLRLTPDARELLISSLGGDRIASRNEIRKLALYCQGQQSVEEHHVREIIGDASAISADEAIDAVLSGDRMQFLHAAEKIAQSKTPIFLVLQGCLRQFQLLDQMRTEMDEKKLQPAQVMQTLGRAVHFKRKPLLERALRTWTSSAIAREMNRLQMAVLQSRQRQALEESIALQLLLSITLQSARPAGRS